MDRLSNVEFKFIWNSFFLVRKYEEVRTSANQDLKKIKMTLFSSFCSKR